MNETKGVGQVGQSGLICENARKQHGHFTRIYYPDDLGRVGDPSRRARTIVVKTLSGTSNSAGAPLKGHVTRARLLTESGDLLGEIPIGTSTLAQNTVVALNIDLASRKEYERVRAALHTQREGGSGHRSAGT